MSTEQVTDTAPVKRIILDHPDDYLDYREGSGSTVEIYDICVGTERGKGRGRYLVQLLLQMVPPGTRLVWAITRGGNFIAQEFYEKLGFRVVGTLRNFYQERRGESGVDAVMYGIDISPPTRR